jgi:hypothetical protein
MNGIRPALYRSILAFTLTVIMVASSGCIGLTAQLLYWMNGGHKIDPEYEGLKEKRVAVVCVSNDSASGPNSLCWMLQRAIGGMLTEKGDEIDVIDGDEIADWIDTNDWDQMDYREIGRGVQADMVLAVDINSLNLHEGRTMYRGRADVTVTVFDMQDGGKAVFRKNIPDFTYPQDGARHVADISEASFRKLFVHVLAQHVAKFFCAFRIEEDIGNDALTLGA